MCNRQSHISLRDVGQRRSGGGGVVTESAESEADDTHSLAWSLAAYRTLTTAVSVSVLTEDGIERRKTEGERIN